ncbi:hypothetical protein AFCA_013362 [Aspergillus flavus]|nr:hypothetical protein AFCA_013362 [Aspergillus flavus]
MCEDCVRGSNDSNLVKASIRFSVFVGNLHGIHVSFLRDPHIKGSKFNRLLRFWGSGKIFGSFDFLPSSCALYNGLFGGVESPRQVVYHGWAACLEILISVVAVDSANGAVEYRKMDEEPIMYVVYFVQESCLQ